MQMNQIWWNVVGCGLIDGQFNKLLSVRLKIIIDEMTQHNIRCDNWSMQSKASSVRPLFSNTHLISFAENSVISIREMDGYWHSACSDPNSIKFHLRPAQQINGTSTIIMQIKLSTSWMGFKVMKTEIMNSIASANHQRISVWGLFWIIVALEMRHQWDKVLQQVCLCIANIYDGYETSSPK